MTSDPLSEQMKVSLHRGKSASLPIQAEEWEELEAMACCCINMALVLL